MAVAVFDADVLIAYLGRRLVSVVSYSEVVSGPLRCGGAGGAAPVDSMLGDLGIETIPVDRAIAGRVAAVRVRTGLELPDAYALTTALAARDERGREVRLESFDAEVVKAYAALAPPPDAS